MPKLVKSGILPKEIKQSNKSKINVERQKGSGPASWKSIYQMMGKIWVWSGS